MKAITSAARLTILLIVTAVGSVTAGLSAEDLSVTVTSGRTFAGHVDQRTDASTLWLRYGGDNITIVRPIRWERVVSARYGGRDVNLETLPELAAHLQTNPSASQRVATPRRRANSSSTTFAEEAQQALGMSPRVRSVAFDAFIANWDGDVEADGLIVRIYPIGGDGRVLPINGSVAMDLTAIRATGFYGHPRGRGEVVDRVGTWTKALREDDFDRGVAELRLPFQSRHPEFATDISSHGLVHIRLVVPGHGVFESSQDAVRIREFAPLRDHLEQTTGSRFLPSERTGR